MFRHLPTDILYLCGELVTGKSIPVLMAIVYTPLDRFLTCIMLLLGYLFGSVFSAWSACNRKDIVPVSLGSFNSILQLYFSMFFSLSFMLCISKTFMGDKGIICSIAPAYCVLCQTLPQRPSTVLIVLLLGISAFYVSMITSIPSIPLVFQDTHEPTIIPSLNKEIPASNSLWGNITNAIQFFILAFYASIHHGVFQVVSGGKSDQHPIYMSHHVVTRFGYSCVIHLVSGLIRFSIWMSVVCFQSNMLHIVLELDNSHVWGWFPSYLFMTALLYESTWNVTQISEQLFSDGETKHLLKLKLVLLTLSKAAMYRFRYIRVLFWLTQILSFISVITTLVTIK